MDYLFTMNAQKTPKVEAAGDSGFSARVARIEVDGVDATWTQHNDGKFELEEIWSEKRRGCGRASRYMRKVIALADELGVTLTLYVHCLYHNLEDTHGIPDSTVKLWEKLDRKTLINDELIAWYCRLGFAICPGSDDENPQMERLPRKAPSTPKCQLRK